MKPRNVLPALLVALFVAVSVAFGGATGQIEGVIEGYLIQKGILASTGTYSVPEASRALCRLYLTGSVSIVTATDTLVSWTGEISDTTAMHDLSSNPERVTINTAGLYHVSARMQWDSNSTGLRRVILYHKNAAGTTKASFMVADTGETGDATYGYTQQVNETFNCVATDYFIFLVRHEKGSNMDLRWSDDPYLTSVSVARVGQ